MFLKIFNSEFQEIKVWFPDQTSKSLEVEDRINVTLIIKYYGLSATLLNATFNYIKMRYSIKPKERRHLRGCGFLSFARNIGTHATKVAKNMSNKYGQKLADTAKKICNRCDKNSFKKSNSKNS